MPAIGGPWRRPDDPPDGCSLLVRWAPAGDELVAVPLQDHAGEARPPTTNTFLSCLSFSTARKSLPPPTITYALMLMVNIISAHRAVLMSALFCRRPAVPLHQPDGVLRQIPLYSGTGPVAQAILVTTSAFLDAAEHDPDVEMFVECAFAPISMLSKSMKTAMLRRS